MGVAVGILLAVKLRYSSSTDGNHGLSRQLDFTTTALSGLAPRKNWSIASDLRRGFQLAQISEPSVRMVGRNSAKLLWLRVWASSIQAMPKPSSDLIDSAF